MLPEFVCSGVKARSIVRWLSTVRRFFRWLVREKIKDNLYQFKWGTGSYCIGINSKVYDVCISNFSRFDNPSDFSYYKLYKDLKAFCPEKFLADSMSKVYYNDSPAYIFDSTVDHSHISNYIYDS